jgi:hypothetical protein
MYNHEKNEVGIKPGRRSQSQIPTGGSENERNTRLDEEMKGREKERKLRPAKCLEVTIVMLSGGDFIRGDSICIAVDANGLFGWLCL